MVGRTGEGAAALTSARCEHHIAIDRPEVAFDWVGFTCHCPNCGVRLDRFQTNDLCNQRDTVDYRIAYHFYAECHCGAWIDFIRKPAVGINNFEMRFDAG